MLKKVSISDSLYKKNYLRIVKQKRKQALLGSNLSGICLIRLTKKSKKKDCL